MITPQHNKPARAIVNVAAENGAVLGLYLILLAVFTGLSSSFGLASLLVWAGSIYLHFYLYRQMRAHHAESGFSLSLAELWAQALMSFLLAALLQAVAVYVLLKFVAPDFVASQMQLAIDTFAATGTPEGDIWAKTLTDLRKANGVPSAADVVSNLIVFNILCGAFMGFCDALILHARYRSTKRRQQYMQSHPGSQTPQ